MRLSGSGFGLISLVLARRHRIPNSMDRIGFLAVFFIVFVVADVSDAAASLSKHKILIGEPQNDNTAVPGKGKEGSPAPSPLLPPTGSSSGGNGPDTKPVDEGPKVGNPKEKEKEKEKQESCAGVTKIKTCAVKDVAVACIKSVSGGSKEVTILVQNVGNSTLNATLSAKGTSKVLEIPKHLNEKVNISIDLGKSTNITLNTGTGECKLHIDPLPLAFPSFKTIATPINGAYFLIVVVLTFGGTWACCLIRKRKDRIGGGVPYQELEMGLPESVPATAVETAEGWDESWDDDWDGENAVKTPGASLGSISVNGLTSRAANKDGWHD